MEARVDESRIFDSDIVLFITGVNSMIRGWSVVRRKIHHSRYLTKC